MHRVRILRRSMGFMSARRQRHEAEDSEARRLAAEAMRREQQLANERKQVVGEAVLRAVAAHEDRLARGEVTDPELARAAAAKAIEDAKPRTNPLLIQELPTC